MTHIILGEINISPLLEAHATLGEALSQVQSTLERDGAIQRFEYCFELAWKTLQRVLHHQGLTTANSPREVFRLSAQAGLIDDVEQWFVFLNHRNNTVHAYNARLADDIFAAVPAFAIAFQSLLNILLFLQRTAQLT